VVIGITGASGLIGSSLVEALRADGCRVVRLVRSGRDLEADTARWDPQTGEVDTEAVGSLDAVIHLAGESIAAHRWSDGVRQRLWDSRVGPTQRLCRFLADSHSPPRSLLCASAVGFYGDTQGRTVDEDSPAGQGFLADLCRAWEAACEPLASAGTRVVHLRFGMVLSGRGGALVRMLPIFRLGLGGPLGNGRQGVSWITLRDVAAAVRFLLDHEEVKGPVNVVAPEPVTNGQFTKALGRALRRPAVLPAPAWALRLLLGRMADEVLLASSRIRPTRLLNAGFSFTMADLQAALRQCLVPY